MVEAVVFEPKETPAEKPAAAAANARPENVPEKFWDAEKGAVNTEALLKSYTELERTRPAGEQPKEGEQPAGEKPNEPTEEEKKAAEDAEKLKAAGVDYSGLQNKWMEQGKIDDADYAKLEGLGFSRAMVDEHIALKQAEAERITNETMGLAGGAEQFAVIADWARTNYTPKQLEEYNAAASSGNVARMQTAVKALKADYDKAKGAPPARTITPTTAVKAAGDSYASNEEFLTDVNTPKYKNDPAERARVMAKLGRSKI